MITIRHTPDDGTLIEGSREGDGVCDVLTWLRTMGRDGDRWCFPGGSIRLAESRGKPAQRETISRAGEALQSAGFAVAIEIDDTQTGEDDAAGSDAS